MDTSKNKGIKTSEFWVATLTAPLVAVVAAVANSFGLTLTEPTIIMLVTPGLAYIFGRIFNKSSAIKADGLIEASKAQVK